jgi:LPXTG-motif cell wall-anchored protein
MLLPSAPAAADIAWPDGLGPDQFRALTVGADSITVGRTHSCAITGIGAPYCWGDNSHGQLGDGSFTDQDRPAAVPTGGPVGQIAVGHHRTCAVKADDDLLCSQATPLAPGGGGDLPATGTSPVLTVALGSLLVGIGLAALLVRRPASRPARRRGTGRHHS